MKTKITNQALFEAKQVKVDLSITGKSYNVSVSWVDDGQHIYQEWDGEFGTNDFLEEFGFQLVPDHKEEEEELVTIWTYYYGNEAGAIDFLEEWYEILGTEPEGNEVSTMDGENAWYFTAEVTKSQIEKLNLEEDWFVK
jgi:hypothetical protein